MPGEYVSQLKLKNAANQDTTVDFKITIPSSVLTKTISGVINTDRRFYSTRTYILKGFVYVAKGTTLKIDAGTVIKGEKSSKGTLIITRGAKIDAQGTATNPIVFTSSQGAGARAQGDWGGVLILGKAPVNTIGGEAKAEGGLVAPAGGNDLDYTFYGGTDAADNSGTLKYVRIEFAGVAYAPDNETNGLTLCGVGSGTAVSFIQVYRSGDDAFEWFGGTVNCDHLVASYSWDDDFDTDYGFSGNVQFGVAQRAVTVADVSGSNGVESDNDGNGSENSPQTKAVFSNMTIIGPKQTVASGGYNASFQHGLRIRRNSSQSIVNSIITGYPLAGVYIDDSKVVGNKTSQNAENGSLKFKNNIIAACPTEFIYTSGWLNANTWYASTGTATFSDAISVGMVDPFKYAPFFSSSSSVGVPNYLLKASSPALTGASFAGLSGFQTVTYRGAFDASNNWLAGWTTFDAENNSY